VLATDFAKIRKLIESVKFLNSLYAYIVAKGKIIPVRNVTKVRLPLKIVSHFLPKYVVEI
jgi:hypothetical protein